MTITLHTVKIIIINSNNNKNNNNNKNDDKIDYNNKQQTIHNSQTKNGNNILSKDHFSIFLFTIKNKNINFPKNFHMIKIIFTVLLNSKRKYT